MRNSVFKDPFSNFLGLESLIDSYTKSYNTPANLKELDGGYELQLSVPGYDKSEINIQIDNSVIKITGKKEVKNEKYLWQEFGTSAFSRSFSLPKEINIDASEAKCKDGVLSLYLPFLKKDKRSNVIKIE